MVLISLITLNYEIYLLFGSISKIRINRIISVQGWTIAIPHRGHRERLNCSALYRDSRDSRGRASARTRGDVYANPARHSFRYGEPVYPALGWTTARNRETRPFIRRHVRFLFSYVFSSFFPSPLFPFLFFSLRIRFISGGRTLTPKPVYTCLQINRVKNGSLNGSSISIYRSVHRRRFLQNFSNFGFRRCDFDTLTTFCAIE